MLRESENDHYFGKSHYERRDKINESVIKDGHSDITETYADMNDLSEAEAERILNEFVDDTFAPRSNPSRQQVNAAFVTESNANEDRAELKEPEMMEEFLYGSLTLSQFDVLKKLKSLAINNDNVAESTLAFKKLRELCAKFELDWQKIPCHAEKRK
jgi:hypothetical protein